MRRQPGNAADAIATARGLLQRGANFDAGLMQINSANFAHLGLTAETVFDPCTNLRAGARVLTDNYSRASAAGHAYPLQAAISEYNTGSRVRGLSNGYVGRVYAARRSAMRLSRRDRLRRSCGRPYGQVTARGVGQILLDAFGGRITDRGHSVESTLNNAKRERMANARCERTGA
ncbi:lytic transglycosylase domain-containing protein [Sphingobium sp. 15-1]|uniref:lytic transglycosylase domain-containing protein n=1 Tax=Sphingobium sp. 15-1 TaxID=2729616 RepID=UPI00159CB426|nr:lytic transglycosylase domain-containing protein [Sphingobium sp. 15-1]